MFASQPLLRWRMQLNRACFFSLLALFAVRPLIAEVFEPVELSFVPQDIGGPTPGTTALLDFFTLLLSACAFALPAPKPIRDRWIKVGLALLALGAVLSTVAAGEKRVAALASANLVALAVGALALFRSMREPWMPRVLMAALLAGGTLNAAKCLMQTNYEFQETWEYWSRQVRPKLIEQGRDLSNPAIVNYERRLRSQNAFGYQAHPNVAASLLAMTLIVGVAACTTALREARLNREHKGGVVVDEGVRGLVFFLVVAATATILIPAPALLATGSLGGMVATVCGLVLFAIGIWVSRTSQSPETRLPRVFWAIVAGLVVVGLGIGVSTGSLPGASLAFRWEYWTAAVRGWFDAPLTGIGRENFLDSYLVHRAAAATEEVRNPHNLFLSLLVELGPVGLVGAAMLIVAALHRLAPHRPDPRPTTHQHRWRTKIALFTAAMVLSAYALLSSTPFTEPGVTVIWIFEFAIVWIAAFLLILGFLTRMPHRSPIFAAGCFAACGAALIHGLVDFALISPGGVALWAGIAVAAMRMGSPPVLVTELEPDTKKIGSQWQVAVAAGLATLAYVGINVFPILTAEAARLQMRTTLANGRNAGERMQANAEGLAAIAADSLDARTPRSVAAAMLETARAASNPRDAEPWLASAELAVSIATTRNPKSVATMRLRRDLERTQMERAGSSVQGAERLAKAIDAAEAVVAAYPTSPQDCIEAGLLHMARWEPGRTAEEGRRAAELLCRALTIDATRGENVAVKLSAERRGRVTDALARLREASVAIPCEPR